MGVCSNTNHSLQQRNSSGIGVSHIKHESKNTLGFVEDKLRTLPVSTPTYAYLAANDQSAPAYVRIPYKITQRVDTLCTFVTHGLSGIAMLSSACLSDGYAGR